MSTPRALRRPLSADDLQRAASLLGLRAQRDVSLAPFTTYRVGGSAALHLHVTTMEDLHIVSSVLSQVEMDVLVIGRGSNMLIADAGFSGIALTFGAFADYIDLPQPEDYPGAVPLALFGGSVTLPVAARQSVKRGLTGMEWGVGVPGSIGGAVRMNAGGHGSDMASSLESMRVFHLRKGKEVRLETDDLGLRFRGSALTDHHVVLSATMRMQWATSEHDGEERLAEIVRWRRENQPGGQNAGSVFVNPLPGEVSAGSLIDQSGLRGFRIGSAHVSEKHANFIQADEGGKSHDVVAVMAEVRRRVYEEHGHHLRSEIRLVGFDPVSEPQFAEVLSSESDTSVATIRLEQIIERIVTSESRPDASIPLSVLSGSQLPPAEEELSPELLAELREAFAKDPTGGVVRPDPSRVVIVNPSAIESIQEPEISSTTSSSRVFIVDEDLRQSTDDDFPADTQSQTVHYAPTSTRVRIFDDDGADVSVEEIELPVHGWSLSALRRRFFGKANSGRSVTKNRRKQFLVVAASLVGFSALLIVVLASPIVAVRSVKVEGVRYANAELIESVIASLRGKSVLTIDTNVLQDRLESDPWIESSRIKTYLPSTAVIEINERIPAAWFVGVDNRARVVDVDGLILAVLDGRPTEYMLIDGVGPNLIAGATSAPEYKAAAQLSQSLPVEIQSMVKNFAVGGPNGLSMVLTTGTIVKFGEPVDMRNKLVNVVVLLRRQDPNGILEIDVSGGTPVVKSA
jgi:UDP-N-acetylmuramate dehydrogenase